MCVPAGRGAYPGDYPGEELRTADSNFGGSVSFLDKLRGLSFSEFMMLVVSVLTLPVVAALLKFRGFRKTERFMALFNRSNT